MSGSPFLSASWRHLAMLNYHVDPATLARYVPRGTELDEWNGRHYVSVVGFMFLGTRLLGVPIPFHRTFEEVNLRFYVRRKGPEGWRRGVAFIKEIVPRTAIALVARWVYNENYVSLPMRHRLELRESPAGGKSLFDGSLVQYEWRFGGAWNSIVARTTGGEALPLAPGSEEEFIAEHYWGYAAQRDGGCVEYRVEHPPWRAWQTSEAALHCDAAQLYGEAFADVLAAPPASAFVAEGSAITVGKGVRAN